ncbi:MAG: phage head-tail connector protein [Clostridium sp.]
MDYLQQIRLEINNENITDDIINLNIERSKTYIKNYCNINDIPEELDYTLIDMSVVIIKSKYIYTLKGKDIKSKSMGDTSVTYNTISYKELSYEEVTSQFSKVLNRHRKLRK